jgi:glutamine amidotransferase
MRANHVLLIDVGTGNLQSVQKALEHCGAQVSRSNQATELAKAYKIVLPGVGAFGDFMHRLRALGLEEALREALDRGATLLGICVGMQALFETGEEMGHHIGLGLLKGKVLRFPERSGIKIPHTGWNALILRHQCPLFDHLSHPLYMYFNHSYYCAPLQNENIMAETDHGILFASAVGNGQIFGVQFHPEKSQNAGLMILKNFLAWNP